MIEECENFVQRSLQDPEIYEHTTLIEGIASCVHPNAVVVPMEAFTLSVVVNDEMCRSKRIFDSYLEHDVSSLIIAQTGSRCTGFAV